MADDSGPVPGPGLAATDEEAARQRVTWAELFVDLVWVFAITEIAGTLAGAHGLGAVARTLLLFVPLWWGWVGLTLLGNTSGQALELVRGRLTLFLLAGCALGMTVAIPGAYTHQGLLYAGCYCGLRLLLWAGIQRHPLIEGLRLNPFAVSLLVGAPLFLAGGLLGGRARVALWTAAALADVLTPVVLRNRLRGARVQSDHLPERFGLFLIIALGETVVAVGGQAAASSLSALTLETLALSFLLIVALWWTYFHYGASAVQHSLATDPVQARIVRDVFSYVHFGYVVGIICVAVGLKKLLAHPLDHPHTMAESLLAPGVTLYLLSFGFGRWRMFGAVGVPRLVATVTCLLIAVTARVMPSLAVAALVTGVLVAVNAVEAWLVTSKRPLPVVHLRRHLTRRTT